jgi:hypothetical protein
MLDKLSYTRARVFTRPRPGTPQTRTHTGARMCTHTQECVILNAFSRQKWFFWTHHTMLRYTRWFKYDRDKLWLVYTQIVPVIFEPPCTYVDSLVETCHKIKLSSCASTIPRRLLSEWAQLYQLQLRYDRDTHIFSHFRSLSPACVE